MLEMLLTTTALGIRGRGAGAETQEKRQKLEAVIPSPKKPKPESFMGFRQQGFQVGTSYKMPVNGVDREVSMKAYVEWALELLYPGPRLTSLKLVDTTALQLVNTMICCAGAGWAPAIDSKVPSATGNWLFQPWLWVLLQMMRHWSMEAGSCCSIFDLSSA